jgi:hypothetical protein
MSAQGVKNCNITKCVQQPVCSHLRNVEIPSFSTSLVHPTHFLPTPSQDNPINSPSMRSTPQETLGNYKRNKWERVLFAFPQFLRRKFVQRVQKQLIKSNCDAFDECSHDTDLWFESRSWHHLECNILPSTNQLHYLYGFCHFAELLLPLFFALHTSTADTDLLRTPGSNQKLQARYCWTL